MSAMAAVARSSVKMIQNSRDHFAIIFVRKRRRRRSGVGGSNTKEYQSAWEKDFQEGDDRQAGGQPGGRAARQERGGRTRRTNPHQSTNPPFSLRVDRVVPQCPKGKKFVARQTQTVEENLRTDEAHTRPHLPFLPLIFN